MTVQRNPFVTTPASWALALVPLAIVFPSPLKTVLYALLLLLSVYLLCADRDARRAYAAALPVALAFALYLPYSLASIWLQDGLPKSADNGMHFLYFVVVAICFLRLKPRRLFWYGISAAAFGAGMLALYQRFGLGIVRPYGMYGVNELGLSGAIKFGMVTAVLSLLALATALDARRMPSARVGHACAALTGFAGCQAISSRGPWLALMIVGLGIALLRIRRIDGRHRWIALSGVLACTAVLAAVFHAEVQERVTATMTEWSSIRAGNLDTSIGARLAMWQAALSMFDAHPLFGVGINQFGAQLKQMIAAGQAPAFIAVYEHTHNEYLESLATGGLVGLGYLLWLFVAPLAFFLRRLARGAAAGADNMAALGGLITVSCFMLFAVSDNIFDRQMTTSLYAFLVLGFAVMSLDDESPPYNSGSSRQGNP